MGGAGEGKGADEGRGGTTRTSGEGEGMRMRNGGKIGKREPRTAKPQTQTPGPKRERNRRTDTVNGKAGISDNVNPNF